MTVFPVFSLWAPHRVFRPHWSAPPHRAGELVPPWSDAAVWFGGVSRSIPRPDHILVPVIRNAEREKHGTETTFGTEDISYRYALPQGTSRPSPADRTREDTMDSELSSPRLDASTVLYSLLFLPLEFRLEPFVGPPIDLLLPSVSFLDVGVEFCLRDQTELELLVHVRLDCPL